MLGEATIIRIRLALAIGLCIAFLAGCATAPTVPVGPVSVEPQRDWSDAVLYFVIVDRFADGDTTNNKNLQPDNPGGWHGGDLRGLAANLDEIADLGATAIWITPVHTQIDYAPYAQGPPETGWQKGFEHHAFHGYWPDDFETTDPRFGSLDDLKALVDAAHSRGIKVLLDVIYNHTGYGSRYEEDEMTTAWFRKREGDCAADPVTCQVGGLPDLKTELPEVREYLLDANLNIAEQSGIDGFRLDTLKHVDHDFWQVHRERTREIDPEFFLLGEVWGGDWKGLDAWFEPDEIDSGFDFSFGGNCLSFVNGRGRTVAYSAYLERRHRVRDGYHLAHYLSTHDTPMFLHELEGDKNKYRLCVALQMTTLGIPVIYYGEEVAREGSVWPVNRADMPWGRRDVMPGKGGKRDEKMRAFYRQMIALRRTHPALSSGSYRRLYSEGDLLVFAREDDTSGDAVVVAVNRGSKASGLFGLAIPELMVGSPLVNAITGGAIPKDEHGMSFTVAPGDVAVIVASD